MTATPWASRRPVQMLTGDERRRLDEIEVQLLETDPRLARSLQTFTPPGRPRRLARWALACAWLTSLLLLIGEYWLLALVLLCPLVGLTAAFITTHPDGKPPQSPAPF